MAAMEAESERVVEAVRSSDCGFCLGLSPRWNRKGGTGS